MVSLPPLEFAPHPIGIAFLLGGIYTLYLGYCNTVQARRVSEMDPQPVRSLTPGTVEVTGTARPIETQTVPAYLSERPALVSEFLVESKRQRSGSKSWTEYCRDRRAVPFLVDDGTGTVRVEVPVDATFDYVREYDRPGFLSFTKMPDHIEALVEQADDAKPVDDRTFSNSYVYRWTTGALFSGEDVYVRGQAVQTDSDWGERPVKITGDDTLEEFIVADMGEAEVIEKRSEQAREYYALGVFLLVIGFAFVYVPFLEFIGPSDGLFVFRLLA